ncbi:MAG: glycosyltransferase [Pseudomonas sp.]|uniref:glycosyltransferase n=1 Tax=Pseudomonas sp. TaxID=306 RepID=UPI002734E825|nr:glycosyltransferase [Pseudomonas sp.]MDP3847596.1 glycosyltransferase [Pseudomonas sp.]
MIILISSKIGQADIHAALGKSEYSYFFLMKDFIPALERVGTVIQVKNLAEIESLYAGYRAAGQDVVFLSFSPPHQVPIGLACPTIAVFAWEFDSLPFMAWDQDPSHDWRYVFAHTQGAITTSKETALLVDSAMQGCFPVISLPAPVWDRYAKLGALEGWPIEFAERQFPFAGIVIDSPILGLSADGLVRKPEPVAGPSEPGPVVKSAVENLLAPSLSLGAAWRLSAALLKGWWNEVRLEPAETTAQQVSPPPPESPLVESQLALEAKPEPRIIGVSGVVYTTVLNPADGRKNWVDLVTAFCWAFKNTEDVTLIVKMTHHDLEHYRVVLMTLLSRLAPFRCRVLVLHGFLEDEQYQALIAASSYYVNASSGEGLCLPLMEFLSSGKPVIAPDHTAMADYLNERVAFLLKCSPEPTCWPHDPTGMLFTHRYRLNWQSLMEAFRSSYQVACSNPAHYQRMSRHAYLQMQDFASIEHVSEPLAAFLQQILTANSAAQETRSARELDL